MNDIVTRDFNAWINDNPGLKNVVDMADLIHLTSSTHFGWLFSQA